jgi:hypothetical protein
LDHIGSSPRMADTSAHRRNGVDQHWQHATVVAVGAAEDRRQRKAVGIGDQIVLGAGFSSVDGTWTGQFAPPTARMEELSTTARDQSIRSAAWR